MQVYFTIKPSTQFEDLNSSLLGSPDLNWFEVHNFDYFIKYAKDGVLPIV